MEVEVVLHCIHSGEHIDHFGGSLVAGIDLVVDYKEVWVAEPAVVHMDRLEEVDHLRYMELVLAKADHCRRSRKNL